MVKTADSVPNRKVSFIQSVLYREVPRILCMHVYIGYFVCELVPITVKLYALKHNSCCSLSHRPVPFSVVVG